MAATFCRRKAQAGPAAPAADTAAVARQLPPLDEVIDSGKVLCLKMSAGTNPGLSRAVGVLLKQAWLQTSQSHLIPIVATQSISSLHCSQTLRTRIFLSLADDSSAQIGSTLCGQVARMKASWTVSEQTARAGALLLSGLAGGGAGSVGGEQGVQRAPRAAFTNRTSFVSSS